MRTICIVAIAALLACKPVFSQNVPRIGFRSYGEGSVVTYWGDSGLRTGDLHNLPNLHSVEISYGTTLTADDLKYLGSLEKIECIQIGQEIIDTPVKIAGDLSVLGKLKHLDRVHLCKQDIKDADLSFVGSLPKITQLEVNADSDYAGGGSTLTDACAIHVARARSLESVYIQGSGRLTDEFISVISEGLSNLEHLNLRCPRLTDASLEFLATRCKKLNWLDLSSNQFTNRGIKHLSNAKNMEMLWIDSSSLTSECIESVASLDQLKHLELTVSTIVDRHAKILANLKKLEILALRRPALSDEQFQMFSNHPKLESAFINGENMSIETTLRTISTIPNLKHLSVGSKNADLQAAVDQMLRKRPSAKH